MLIFVVFCFTIVKCIYNYKYNGMTTLSNVEEDKVVKEGSYSLITLKSHSYDRRISIKWGPKNNKVTFYVLIIQILYKKVY